MNVVLSVICRQTAVRLCFQKVAQTCGATVAFDTCRNIERELQGGNEVQGGIGGNIKSEREWK